MRKCTLNAVAPGTLISYRERHAIVLEHLPQGVFVQLVDPIEDHAFAKRTTGAKATCAST